jgi:hypothetical protein
MRVAILDDIHHAYEGTPGVSRLRARAEVEIFTESCREPNALKNFDALVANRERTRFSRAVHDKGEWGSSKTASKWPPMGAICVHG